MDKVITLNQLKSDFKLHLEKAEQLVKGLEDDVTNITLTKELLVTQAKIEELTILIELAKGDI
jgi:hypothetical protein